MDAELFFSSDETPRADADGKLIWKPICRTGTWKLNPLDPAKPLVLDKPFFDDVVASFKDGAWEHVTVPLSHADRLEENTGFVRDLKLREDPKRQGEYVLEAALDIRDPEIKRKVEQGTIANTSIGVATKGIKRIRDGKFFPRVMKHVALTNAPWIDGLEPFGGMLAASIYTEDNDPTDEDFVEFDLLTAEDVETLTLASKPTHLDPETAKNHGSIMNIVRSAHKWGGNGVEAKFEKIKRVLMEKHPEVIAKAFGGDPNKAAAWIKDQWWSIFRPGTQWRKGGKKKDLHAGRTVIRLTKGGVKNMAGENGNEDGNGTLELTQEALDEMIEQRVKEREDAMNLKLSQQNAQLREMSVDRKIADLQKKGHAPAVLKTAREFYVADEGDVMLSLAKEDGESEKLTATDVIDRVLDALPETALHLSNVDVEENAGSNNGEKKSVEERAKEQWDELHADPVEA